MNIESLTIENYASFKEKFAAATGRFGSG